MKKEQEEEAVKRVAEERTKRAANDHQSTNNGHDKVNQQEIPPAPKQTIRQPSPPPIQRPTTPYSTMQTPLPHNRVSDENDIY